ncbi:MAG TPA: hypothetical protein VK668_09735 [Mucilaginibacter sp.]|nr:hypothetical protein [Mucilaginibacter sp.]
MQNRLNELLVNEIHKIIPELVGFFLIYKGIALMLKQTKSESIIEMNFVIGSFKITTPSAGLILCFLGFILIVLGLVFPI